MRKKILIFGHYGVPNWGDEAILAGIISQIDPSKYSITVVSDAPEFSIEQSRKFSETKISAILPPPFGVRSFVRGIFSRKYGFFHTKKAISEADFILFGGGGLFQDRPEKAIKIWNFYLKICQKYMKKKNKIFLAGNSFELLHSSENYNVSKTLFGKIPFFSVRDEYSQKILETQFQVPAYKITSSSDAAYFLPRNTKKGRKKGILLAIRDGEIPEKKEKKLLKILKKQFPNEFEKNLVTVLVMQEKKSGDKNFALRHSLPFYIPKNNDQVQEKIRSSKFVLTSRLHAGILANICGTPFLALSMRDKISQFFGEKFSFSFQKIFTKKGEKEFISALSDYKTLKTSQHHFYEQQTQKLRKFFPEIF